MPREDTLASAVLRALGGSARQVGSQIQANQIFNQQAEAENLQERLRFEATEGHRATMEGQGQQRIDIAQRGQDLKFPMGPPAPEPKTMDEIIAELGQQALEKGGTEGFLEFDRRLHQGRKSPAKPKAAPTVTPLQRKGLIDKRLEEQQEDILGRADATGIEDLRGMSQKGIDRRVDVEGFNPFTTFGTRPDPDSTAFNQLQELEQTRSPEARQAINDSIQRGLLFPELGIAGGQDGQVSPEIEKWGQSEYHNWDELTPEQKSSLAKKHGKM